MTGSDQSAEILAQLFEVIESRRDRDVGSSYTAKLFASGTEKIAQKVGEEAVETVIEAMKSKGVSKLAEESADLLYHLLVLWADKGVKPEEVWNVLAERFGLSGIEEKNLRQRD